MAERKSKATKKTTTKKSAPRKKRSTRVTKSTAPKTKKAAKKATKRTPKKAPKKAAKRADKKTNKSKSKPTKSEVKVREIKVGDLEKLYLPVAIIVAGVLIGCGLFGGLLYTDGSLGSTPEYQCNSYEPLSRDCLRQYAKDTDLKFSKFEQCVNDQKHYEEITADIDALKEYGIEGTPHVVLGEMKDDKLNGFYAGGAQGFEYYQDLINQIKENGVKATHEKFITENLGTVEELTERYKEAYRAQYTTEDLSDSEVQELSELAAQSRFESYGIREYDIKGSITIGEEDASIVMLEYSDYECSYCKSFAQETLPELKSNFIDNGELLFVYKSLPLEETPAQGYRAANAAKCANDQEKFLDYHNLLFGIEE